MTLPQILLVENEALLRELTCEDPSDAGYPVTSAGDGHEALQILAAQRFDILLTDIRMPGNLDGWELARIARENWPDLKVVDRSGYSPEVVQPVRGGRFLKKPCRLDDLLRVLGEISAV